jgi:hypothetical protein
MKLGDKISLGDRLAEITGIATGALAQFDPDMYSVEERFQWGEKRQTTEEEDKVYCMMGIFRIHMLPMYSEGGKNAMNRLKRKIQKSSKFKKHSFRVCLLCS